MSILEKIQLIMALSALFALIHVFKIKNKWAKGITAAYVVSVALSFVRIQEVKIDSYYLFCLLGAATILYSVSISTFSDRKKLIIALIAITSTLPNFFFISGFAASDPAIFSKIILLGIIPVLAYLYVLLKFKNEFHDEHGILTVLAVNGGIWFFPGLFFL